MTAAVLSLPDDVRARLRAFIHAKFGAEVKRAVGKALHTYTREDGTPLFWRLRLKFPDGTKLIRPIRKDGDEFAIGEPQFVRGTKPLYRLHELADPARRAEPVVVTEGENCADALATLGLLATTSGGASSAAGADWTPLRGRHVIMWPDADTAGAQYGRDVVAALLPLGCRVEVVDVAALGLPEGGDAVDWLAAHAGATRDDVLRLPRAPAVVESAADASSGSALILHRASDIVAVPIRWLWPGRIARGKLTVIAGHAGLGKSQMAISMAAITSRGGVWPVDRTPCERGDVILLSAEDDAADTIRPRLEAAGADLARCHVVEAVRDHARDGRSIRRGFHLMDDIDALDAAIARIGDVALVVVDPVSAYLGGIDTHRASDVRAVLAPLADLAARRGVAVAAVTHLRKMVGNDGAIHAVVGSVSFVAAARAAYVVTKDASDASRRLLLPIKNNIGTDDGGLAFSIESVTLSGGIGTSRVVWHADRVTVTADEALAANVEAADGEARDAAAWLREVLADGPMPARELERLASECGHAWRTVQRAARSAGVEIRREGFGRGARYTWRMASTEADSAASQHAMYATCTPCTPTQNVGAHGAHVARMAVGDDDTVKL